MKKISLPSVALRAFVKAISQRSILLSTKSIAASSFPYANPSSFSLLFRKTFLLFYLHCSCLFVHFSVFLKTIYFAVFGSSSYMLKVFSVFSKCFSCIFFFVFLLWCEITRRRMNI